MPSASNFLLNFGLTKSKILAGYTLTQADATHDIIKQYQEYRYVITLTFTNNGSGTYENLYYTLEPYISTEHSIYGIRNTYRCVIDPVFDNTTELFTDGTIIFHLLGHAYRH